MSGTSRFDARLDRILERLDAVVARPDLNGEALAAPDAELARFESVMQHAVSLGEHATDEEIGVSSQRLAIASELLLRAGARCEA